MTVVLLPLHEPRSRQGPISPRDPRSQGSFTPRSWEAIEEDLARLPPWATEVLLVGDDAVESPHLIRAIEALSGAGRPPILFTDAQALSQGERLLTLRSRGLRSLAIHFLGGTPERHDAALGLTAAWMRSRRVLHESGMRDIRRAVAILPDLPPEDLPGLCSLAAAQGAELMLVASLDPRHPAWSPPSPQLDALSDDAWRSCAAADIGLRVVGAGLRLADRAPPACPPAEPTLLTLARAGFLPPAARSGLTWAGRRDATQVPAEQRRRDGLLLRAVGSPALDLPVCEGGPGTAPEAHQDATRCTPCPQRRACTGTTHPPPRPLPAWRIPGRTARIDIVALQPSDRVQMRSTLPGLAQALRQRGHEVRLHTAQHVPWHPDELDLVHPPRLLRPFGDRAWGWMHALRQWEERLPRSLRLTRFLDPAEPFDREDHELGALWRNLDLRGADVVIVPGFVAAHRLLPRLPSGAELLVADFHMLEGVDTMLSGGPWPDHIRVHACFPRYAPQYEIHGVPLEAVYWRPYPLYLPHFGEAPDPLTCEAIFCGGGHLRDIEALQRLARRLRGRIHPIDVIVSDKYQVEVVPPLRRQMPVPLVQFIDAIRRCRFVILPLVPDPIRAAGITILSLAQAFGRPVISTLTAATADHIHDDVDGLLFDPGDTDGMADAIARLDADPALLRRLSAGAARAAQRLSVETWASEILEGPLLPPAPDARGRFRPW